MPFNPLFLELIVIAVVAYLIIALIRQRKTPPWPSDQSICRSCGAAHPPFAQFCRTCGKKLEK